MLSLEECRQILGDKHDLSDADLRRLRRDLYTMAEIIVSAAPAAKPPVNFRKMMQLIDSNQGVELEERAAIMEHDGGCTRDAAEHAALVHFEILDRTSR